MLFSCKNLRTCLITRGFWKESASEQTVAGSTVNPAEMSSFRFLPSCHSIASRPDFSQECLRNFRGKSDHTLHTQCKVVSVLMIESFALHNLTLISLCLAPLDVP